MAMPMKIEPQFQILVVLSDNSLTKDFAFNTESLAGHIRQHKQDGAKGMYVIKAETGECKYASALGKWVWHPVPADNVKTYFE